MTHTAIPPAPDDPVLAVMNRQAPSGVRPGPVARLRAHVRDELQHTPGQLQVAAVLAVLAALIVGLGGGAALRERSQALDDARDAAAHLVLVQGIQTRLTKANADATNGYLRFGVDPQSQSLDYINQIKLASADLALAARTSDRDAEVLGAVNAGLTRYTGYIASARAYNRLSLPVGANYLSVAGDEMNNQVLGSLGKAAVRDQDDLDGALRRAGNARWWLLVVALVGLGGLVAVQLWLARRTRRILNVPLAASTALTALMLVIGAGAMAYAQSAANDVTGGSLKEARALSTSRLQAFLAKSQESLNLIQRGSGTPEDADWVKYENAAVAALPPGNDAAKAALQDYARVHKAINARDVSGDWKGAARQATLLGGDTANAAFNTYDARSQAALTTEKDDAINGLDDAGFPLLPAGILILIAGLIAAVGAWWGFMQRLDEYR